LRHGQSHGVALVRRGRAAHERSRCPWTLPRIAAAVGNSARSHAAVAGSPRALRRAEPL